MTTPTNSISRSPGKERFFPGPLLTASLLLLSTICLASASPDGASSGQWLPISNGVLKKLAEEGRKPAWPGGTAGVSVDRPTGDVRIIIPDQGIWRSSDGGVSFERQDGGTIGGRCETGFALNADPAGRRIACFMLDGRSGMTLDGRKSWSGFGQMGRGWDFGAVDWSGPAPRCILAVHHESGGELQYSEDAGKTWRMLGKEFTAIGNFGPGALVASKGEGILRSADGGATWTKVSTHTPTGRVLCVFNHVGYWVSKEGLLVSRDRGDTWSLQGSAIEAAWGPFFGKSVRQIVVAGRLGGQAGLWLSDDGGAAWKLAAPFPAFEHENGPDWTPSKQWAAGWFVNFGWDPGRHLFYASRMGHPAVRITSK